MVTDASLAYGLVVMFFSSVLCSSAGVGGGSLNVPILYSIIGFDYDTAVVLSLCTLMGNYLLQVLVNLDKRHPSDPSVPLIYWDAVLIMLPSELGGANVGVIFAKSIPKTIIFILAIAVLVLAVYFTGRKGLKLYEHETHAIQLEEENEKGDYDEVLSDSGNTYSPVTENKLPLLTGAHTGASSLLSGSLRLADVTSDSSSELNWPTMVRKANTRKNTKVTLASIIPPYLCCYFKCCTAPAVNPHAVANGRRFHSKAQSASESEPSEYAYTETTDNNAENELPPIVFPWSIIAVILAVFAIYVVCFVVQKQYNMCELGSYISLGIIYVLLLLQVLWGLRYLVNGRRAKQGLGAQLEGEIKWGHSSLMVPLVSFLIGVTSALLGIGGGELMGPMMLMLRVSDSAAELVCFGMGSAYSTDNGKVPGYLLAVLLSAHWYRGWLYIYHSSRPLPLFPLYAGAGPGLHGHHVLHEPVEHLLQRDPLPRAGRAALRLRRRGLRCRGAG
jgi:uncharacterized membrane protein YfcA